MYIESIRCKFASRIAEMKNDFKNQRQSEEV